MPDAVAIHEAYIRGDLDALRALLSDPDSIELLLSQGADPHARTRIDDRETPLEEAERCGKKHAAATLRAFLERTR